MKMETKKIADMSLMELKAAAYDHIKFIDALKKEVSAINEEIARRQTEKANYKSADAVNK
jgi:hypothetical protein